MSPIALLGATAHVHGVYFGSRYCKLLLFITRTMNTGASRCSRGFTHVKIACSRARERPVSGSIDVVRSQAPTCCCECRRNVCTMRVRQKTHFQTTARHTETRARWAGGSLHGSACVLRCVFQFAVMLELDLTWAASALRGMASHLAYHRNARHGGRSNTRMVPT